jgi:hypothetical protein
MIRLTTTSDYNEERTSFGGTRQSIEYPIDAMKVANRTQYQVSEALTRFASGSAYNRNNWEKKKKKKRKEKKRKEKKRKERKEKRKKEKKKKKSIRN